MKRVLLTGMSGTGKSAVVQALDALGHKAIDTDYGWCVTAPDGEWVWDENLVDRLLSTEDATVLFLAGCASNQGKFRDRLDLVVLLSAPVDVMLERVRTRTNNPFGSNDEDVQRIIDDHANVEPLLRASADHEVMTDRPLSTVVDEILRLIG